MPERGHRREVLGGCSEFHFEGVVIHRTDAHILQRPLACNGLVGTHHIGVFPYPAVARCGGGIHGPLPGIHEIIGVQRRTVGPSGIPADTEGNRTPPVGVVPTLGHPGNQHPLLLAHQTFVGIGNDAARVRHTVQPGIQGFRIRTEVPVQNHRFGFFLLGSAGEKYRSAGQEHNQTPK